MEHEQGDDLLNEMNATTEFDDSPEADAIRKYDDADRIGDISECTWVRKYPCSSKFRTPKIRNFGKFCDFL